MAQPCLRISTLERRYLTSTMNVFQKEWYMQGDQLHMAILKFTKASLLSQRFQIYSPITIISSICFISILPIDFYRISSIESIIVAPLSISNLRCTFKANFLSDAKLKTPVFVRFSTVLGSRGSADTVRDVRGFATRFYTQEGNFDIVGNNIPIFFIQDAMKVNQGILHSISMG